MARLRDRASAGARLAGPVAQWLAERPGLPPPVVLALPRGGVPVALPVARHLGAPLDLVMVRKLGAPGQPELAVAAVVEGDPPLRITNPGVMSALGLAPHDLDAAEAQALQEIARRRRLWLRDRAPVPVAGRTAVVIDDGLATGATLRAALAGLRARGAAAVLVAVPVAAAETLAALQPEVDGLLCLHSPHPFFAIGAHYEDFRQLEDAEIPRLLAAAAAPPTPPGPQDPARS